VTSTGIIQRVNKGIKVQSTVRGRGKNSGGRYESVRVDRYNSVGGVGTRVSGVAYTSVRGGRYKSVRGGRYKSVRGGRYKSVRGGRYKSVRGRQVQECRR
jgi:hypothetical protein